MDLNAFALQLQGAHKILAMVAKNPLWELQDDEAKKLAQAIKGVLKYHQIPVSPQMLAYIQLAGVSAVVYGPRIAVSVSVGKMKKAEAKKKAAQVANLDNASQAAPATLTPAPFMVNDPGQMQ